MTRLEITQPTGAVQAWVPLPLSQDTDWFQTLENSASGNFERSRIVHEPVYRAAMVAATFRAGEPQPVVEVTSRFETRDQQTSTSPGKSNAAPLWPEERAFYTEGHRASCRGGRHRPQDRPRGHQGREDGNGKGPRPLRVDRGQHLPRSPRRSAAAAAT